jgi:NADH:ubiquinone oxidoreductase subunit 6 (subunit J)
MHDVTLFAAAALTLIGALAVVACEAPIRAAGGLVTAFVGAAALAGAHAAPFAPGLLLLVGCGVGLVMIAAVLVLTPLSAPLSDGAAERLRRRLRVRSGATAPVLGLLFALLAGALLPIEPAVSPPAPPAAEDVARALADDLAVALALALLAVAGVVVASLSLLRRRS